MPQPAKMFNAKIRSSVQSTTVVVDEQKRRAGRDGMSRLANSQSLKHRKFVHYAPLTEFLVVKKRVEHIIYGKTKLSLHKFFTTQGSRNSLFPQHQTPLKLCCLVFVDSTYGTNTGTGGELYRHALPSYFKCLPRSCGEICAKIVHVSRVEFS